MKQITMLVSLLFLSTQSMAESKWAPVMMNDIMIFVLYVEGNDPQPPVNPIETVFTSELIVGKTYQVIGNDRDTTLTWSQESVSYIDNGATGTLSYSIEENGVIIINTPDGDAAVYTLISVEANGDLKVTEKQPSGEKELLWVLI